MAPFCAFQHAQEGFKIGVPADAETVFPSAEDGISGFEFEVGFSLVAPEARRTHVADVVGEIGVQAADLQRHVQIAEGRCRGLVVLRRGPLHAVEVVFEVRALVREPVAFFGRKVAAPVADFDVALQQRGVDDGFGELVAHAGGFEGAGGDEVVVGAVGEGAALAFGGAADGVRDVGGREFEFGFLLEGGIGGGGVGAEGVAEVLSVALADFEGEGGQG